MTQGKFDKDEISSTKISIKRKKNKASKIVCSVWRNLLKNPTSQLKYFLIYYSIMSNYCIYAIFWFRKILKAPLRLRNLNRCKKECSVVVLFQPVNKIEYIFIFNLILFSHQIYFKD